MKNSKILCAALLAALAFSGCGSVSDSDNSESEKQNPESSVADTSEGLNSSDSSENIDESKADSDNIADSLPDDVAAAAVKVSNAYNTEDLSCSVSDEQEKILYENMKNMLADSESAEKPNGTLKASVCFKFLDSDNGETLDPVFLSVYDGNIFGVTVGSGAETYFSSESAAAYEIRKDIYSAAVLDLVFKSDNFTIGGETEDESGLVEKAAEKYTDNFDEYIYIYSGDRADYYVNVECGNGVSYFCSLTSTETDADVGGSTLYDMTDYYEYITDGKAQYYRPDQNDVWYAAESFEGSQSIDSLPKRISNAESYVGKFEVTQNSNSYMVEHWAANLSDAYVLFDGSGEIVGAWYSGESGVTAVYGYRISQADTDNLAEILSDAEAKLSDGNSDSVNEKTVAKTDEEYLAEDTAEYDLLDLSGEKIKGETITNAHTVSDWRDYFANNTSYTVEFYQAGAGRLEHHVYTREGDDFYTLWDAFLHEDNGGTGSEEICIGDTVYNAVYYLGEYDSRTFYSSAKDEYTTAILPQPFDPDDDVTFVDAYYVTVGGETYECEEWKTDYHDFAVYSKDGEIIAYETDFYDKPVVCTIKKFSKSSDSSLIKAPEKSEVFTSYE